MQKINYDIKKIKNQIDKYEYISFDIFDTLIKRNVAKPSDVFELVSIEYKKKYNKNIENFREIRISAERRARDLVEGREPNIDDIYKNIEVDSEIKVDELKNIEINMELSVCQQNKDLYEIYKYCLQKDKKIIITSDMYLNKEIIEKILINAGIVKYNKLFLSNEIKLNKHNGKIYKYILQDLKIKANKIIHIGDSKRGDFIQARANGIKSILIPKNVNKLSYYNIDSLEQIQYFEYKNLQAFINNNINLNKSEYFNVGYEILGILLYGYSKWLIENLKKNNIEKVFFLAREGSLLKKAFDIINDSNIKSEYLYISRRSVRPALLENIETLQDLCEIINIKETTDVRKFIKDIGLDYRQYEKTFNKFNYNLETKVKSINNLEEIFETLKNDIKNNARKEKENILGYLKQKSFSNHIAISDVGWAGTMQKSLCTIFNEYKIKGFYIATTNELKDIEKYGFLHNYDEIRPFVHLFENLFLAQHGTTLKYELKNEKYEPVLDIYEYSEKEAEIFKEIQDGAIQFIKDFISNKFDEYYNVDAKISTLGIIKLGLYPTQRDIKKFENIPYMETVKKNLIEAKNFIYYIFHLKSFKYNFFDSGWKIGFLKKVFKFNLPYFKIYNYLLKYKEKK